MKVLQVNCVYGKGSTGKIMQDIHRELLARGHESVVCYGRGTKAAEDQVYKVCPEWYAKANNLLSRFTGLMYGGCFFSTNKLISIIKKEKPDVVHLHCINGYFVNIYRLITWLKNRHVKTVLTLHAEFMHTANCGHALDCEKWKTGCEGCRRWKKETKSLFLNRTAASWQKMKKAFDGFEQDCLITSVSPWLMERAKSAPILEKFRHVTVMNGLDTEVFCPQDGTEVREKLQIGDRKMVLHVTAGFSLDPDHLKGGYYVAELAKLLPEMAFVVVGSRDPHMELPENVINVGRLESQKELAAYYSAADVTLLTSKRETFSMVTAESLCCGTSVVGFKAGAPEGIALPEYSGFAEQGDLEHLRQLVLLHSERPADHISAHQTYGKRQMVDGYLGCYEEKL